MLIMIIIQYMDLNDHSSKKTRRLKINIIKRIFIIMPAKKFSLAIYSGIQRCVSN